MKNLFKGIASVILVSLTTTFFGISPVKAQSETGLSNMTLVEVIKDQVFELNTECGTVYSDKVTVQNKGGIAHTVTALFTVSKDHCLILNSAYHEDWYGLFRVIINPGGKIIVKMVLNE